MLVSRDEGDVAQLTFKEDAQSLDAVAHGVGRGDPREVLKEIGDDALVGGLLEVVVVGAVLLEVVVFHVAAAGWRLLGDQVLPLELLRLLLLLVALAVDRIGDLNLLDLEIVVVLPGGLRCVVVRAQH